MSEQTDLGQELASNGGGAVTVDGQNSQAVGSLPSPDLSLLPGFPLRISVRDPLQAASTGSSYVTLAPVQQEFRPVGIATCVQNVKQGMPVPVYTSIQSKPKMQHSSVAYTQKPGLYPFAEEAKAYQSFSQCISTTSSTQVSGGYGGNKWVNWNFERYSGASFDATAQPANQIYCQPQDVKPVLNSLPPFRLAFPVSSQVPSYESEGYNFSNLEGLGAQAEYQTDYVSDSPSVLTLRAPDSSVFVTNGAHVTSQSESDFSLQDVKMRFDAKNLPDMTSGSVPYPAAFCTVTNSTTVHSDAADNSHPGLDMLSDVSLLMEPYSTSSSERRHDDGIFGNFPRGRSDGFGWGRDSDNITTIGHEASNLKINPFSRRAPATQLRGGRSTAERVHDSTSTEVLPLRPFAYPDVQNLQNEDAGYGGPMKLPVRQSTCVLKQEADSTAWYSVNEQNVLGKENDHLPAFSSDHHPTDFYTDGRSAQESHFSLYEWTETQILDGKRASSTVTMPSSAENTVTSHPDYNRPDAGAMTEAESFGHSFLGDETSRRVRLASNISSSSEEAPNWFHGEDEDPLSTRGENGFRKPSSNTSLPSHTQSLDLQTKKSRSVSREGAGDRISYGRSEDGGSGSSILLQLLQAAAVSSDSSASGKRHFKKHSKNGNVKPSPKSSACVSKTGFGRSSRDLPTSPQKRSATRSANKAHRSARDGGNATVTSTSQRSVPHGKSATFADINRDKGFYTYNVANPSVQGHGDRARMAQSPRPCAEEFSACMLPGTGPETSDSLSVVVAERCSPPDYVPLVIAEEEVTSSSEPVPVQITSPASVASQGATGRSRVVTRQRCTSCYGSCQNDTSFDDDISVANSEASAPSMKKNVKKRKKSADRKSEHTSTRSKQRHSKANSSLPCDYCGRKFSSVSNLSRHQRTLHHNLFVSRQKLMTLLTNTPSTDTESKKRSATPGRQVYLSADEPENGMRSRSGQISLKSNWDTELFLVESGADDPVSVSDTPEADLLPTNEKGGTKREQRKNVKSAQNSKKGTSTSDKNSEQSARLLKSDPDKNAGYKPKTSPSRSARKPLKITIGSFSAHIPATSTTMPTRPKPPSFFPSSPTGLAGVRGLTFRTKCRTRVNSTIQCPYCPKKFSVMSNLKRHTLQRHDDVHVFFCNVCDAKLSMRRILRNHVKLHINTHPFVCRECLACFDRKSKLRTHSKSHVIDKFPCSVCDLVFYTREHLASHNAYHHG